LPGDALNPHPDVGGAARHPRAAGFFGKLPSRGDFVGDGLSPALVRRWDAWLQRVLPDALAALGPEGGEAWDAAPAWLLSPMAGLCGGQAWTGAMLPSRDRAGRRFPLLLAVEPAAPDAALGAALARIGRAAIAAALAPEALGARLRAAAAPPPCPAPPLAALPDALALARILRP
jgi:type VI secretion system protein ImpM